MAKSFQDSLTDAQLMLISKAQKAGPDALSDGELQELSSLNKRYKVYQEPEMTGKEAALEVGKGALNVAGRVLDLPGGIVRTGVGAAAGVAGTDDLLQALVGNAPSTSTLLERGGVGEMGTYRMPIIGTEFTGRGAVGLLGDVASGLGASAGLKAAAKGTGLLAKAASVARAPEAAIEAGMNAAGKAAYRSGMKRLDRAAELMGKGKNAVSDVLGKRNIWGGARSIQEGADNVVNDLQKKVEKAIAQATASGKTINIEKALAPARAEALSILSAQRASGVKADVAKYLAEMDDLIAQSKVPGVPVMPQRMKPELSFKNGEFVRTEVSPSAGGLLAPKETVVPASEALVTEVTPDIARPYTASAANEVKKDIYGLFKDPKWAALANNSTGEVLMKRGVRGIKEAIEEVAPGVREMNQEIAPLLSAKKKMASELTKEINREAIGTLGPMVAAINPLVAAAKYAADVAKGTPFKTGGGLLLQNATTQNLAKQALLESLPGERGQMDDNLNLVVERIRRKYGK